MSEATSTNANTGNNSNDNNNNASAQLTHLYIPIVKNQALIPLFTRNATPKSLPKNPPNTKTPYQLPLSPPHENFLKVSTKTRNELDVFLKLIAPLEPLQLIISIQKKNLTTMGIANRSLGQIVKDLNKKTIINGKEVDTIPTIEEILENVENSLIFETNSMLVNNNSSDDNKSKTLNIPIKGYSFGLEYNLCIELHGYSQGKSKYTVTVEPFEDTDKFTVTFKNDAFVLSTTNNESSSVVSSTGNGVEGKKEEKKGSNNKKEETEQEKLLRLLMSEDKKKNNTTGNNNKTKKKK
ncbi:hypothetical protein ABK040_015725 [Willaertia magna]